MAKEKINTKDFNNCPLDKWNGTTFREYAKHLNIVKNGIPCISNNIMVENCLIKTFTKEFGNEVFKLFIEECVNTHKGSDKYPTCNIGFMITYLKASILPRVLHQEIKKTKTQQYREELEKEFKSADVAEYF